MAAKDIALLSDTPLLTESPYAERDAQELPWYDRVAEFLGRLTVQRAHRLISPPTRRLQRIVALADRHEATLSEAPDHALQALARRLRKRLRREGFTPALVGECFALVREAAGRTLGRRHYPSQLMAGWGLLQGRLIEMETGEGKTLSATLAAGAVALAGYPVHVITVNDYLARRDAGDMGPLYRFLGLTVAAVSEGMSPADKQAAYGCAISYCTNKDLAFDYLRDRVASERSGGRLRIAMQGLAGDPQRQTGLTLRGLYFAIVDEADSVFIDEARTPLILSASVKSEQEAGNCAQALELARGLQAGEAYYLDMRERRVNLTEAGIEQIDDWADGREGVWSSTRGRRELIEQALSALLLFHRDKHYVVREDKVQIVDESTGRIMADRSWERGLQQMIETKEQCALSDRRETLARITYQRLFRRYVRLSGMTGTASEVKQEIKSVYRLDVVRVPLHRPSRRRYRRLSVFATREDKWNAVAGRVADLSVRLQRPVLIGTRSVKASEEISAVLQARGIDHALLNAKQDKSESEVIARAGQPARVTVATNMAGRGTDIQLGAGVPEHGGLHVILTEYHESRRVDRQLFGRCARQGDSGSCEAMVSLEDELFTLYAPRLSAWLRRMLAARLSPPAWLFHGLRVYAQHEAERRNAWIRLQNLKQDKRLDKILAFSGRGK